LSHRRRLGSTRPVAQMTQQSAVQEADDRERKEKGEGEEAAVEDASDAVRGVPVDVDVNTGRPRLTSETVIDDVVVRQQRTVGDGHDQPHEADDDDRVALSAKRTRDDRVNDGQVAVQRHQHLHHVNQPRLQENVKRS